MKRIRNVINRLRFIWRLSNEYSIDIAMLHQKIDGLHQLIQERTTVHADVHCQHHPHQVLVVGKYRNRDYVRCFNLEAGSWQALVEQLRQLEKHARVGRFDMPHLMEFSAVYERERL